MPTYVYALKPKNADAPPPAGCAYCREGFEAVQRMSDEALRTCPQCGAPVERVIQAPHVGNLGNKLKGPSESTLKKAGFTQFKRAGKGKYEKTFGKGGPPRLGG